MSFNQTIKEKILILDGAMGTNLFDKGRKAGESPSLLNLRNPDAVLELQRAYIEAGSNIILTNTFGADAMHFSSYKLNSIILKGIDIAKKAARKKAYIWGDITTLGELIKPYGELDFFEARRIYSLTIRKFSRNLKALFLETFTSIIDAKAAFLAAKEFTNNIFISFAYEDNAKTIMGESPESIALIFEALGARGIGVNCTHPEIAVEVISRMAKVTHLPLIAKPNAGKVEIIDGKVEHSLSDEELAFYFDKLQKAGANIIGGCCGSTPDYIKLIAAKHAMPVLKAKKSKWVLVSPSKVIDMDGKKVCIVGERLNPAGNRKLREALEKQDYSLFAEEARLQEQRGADCLDVSAFLIDLDEKEALTKAIYEVIKVSSLPLFIDTKDLNAAKIAMEVYPGIGVINSIPAKKNELKKWLPIIKKYGFKAVVSLLGNSIPKTDKDRIKYYRRVKDVANGIEFPVNDLIFDPLVLSAATDNKQIYQTLAALNYIHRSKHKTILGISNISYGLTNRALINAALIPVAIYNGINFLIVNPLSTEIMSIIEASGVIFNSEFRRVMVESKSDEKVVDEGDIKQLFKEALLRGEASKSEELSLKLLKGGVSPNEIIDEYITSSLQLAGELYQQGKYFVPDLLLSAEAATRSLEVIKPYLPKSSKKGKIVLATVHGDIHDVGKNIVSVVLQAAGYEIIDLGKDVSALKIVNAVKEHHPDFVGLSALLTTTMPEMEKVIKLLRKNNLDVKVIIGGPNVSLKYAERIGAYGAARNIGEGLKLLN